MRNALYVALALIAVAAIIVFYPAGHDTSGMPSAGPARLAGAPAVSFAAKRLDGTSDQLSNYRGKIVLMNLWASWCPPCVGEFPDLERVYRQFSERGVVVLGVDQGESIKTARAFAAKHGATFPILVDEDQHYGGAYSALGLPTTVIIDRQGKIVVGVDGALTLDRMRSLLQSALSRG